MLKITCLPQFEKQDPCEMVVLPFWEGPAEAADLTYWNDFLSQPIESGDFKAKVGETLLLYDNRRVLLVGLGKKEKICAETLRRAYSSAVRIAQSKKTRVLHCIFPHLSNMSHNDVLCAIADGLLLTNYLFSRYKDLKEPAAVLLEKAVICGVDQSHDAMLAKLSTIASGVYLVRELVNGNADDITPKMLAETALSIEKQHHGIKALILDKKHLEKEKMGLLLAVNRGSSLDPYLITLAYKGNPKSKEHIVLVGKGITYDTGGLALKPPENMSTMKSDMAGAATVLGVIQTVAALRLPVNVTAVAPVTENSIDANSYKIGDVYRCMNGKTVEVNNTDAEGRLILADAMSYAVKYLNPTLVIDIASLTGGIVVALGEEIAGLFCNDDRLAQDLQTSSQSTGENLWRMPLYSDYLEILKSEIADMINSGGKSASSMTAALFLQEFSGSVPWAHIDMAGPCYVSKPKFYNTAKATGFGLRLLVDFLERRSS
jgi:leucyl aminopeptidase